MKINTLQLENFQGIKAATFDFAGGNASIYGDNGTGKTTVFNALTWLLFDQASTGAKNYSPKTTGPDGYLHNLDHAAEATFTIDGGRMVRLRKVFHEVWKKKRGAATAEFDGHSVDFYIDGAPVKEKEYTATLAAFCGGAERMKMLTMPDYFPETMSWDARRKILLDICGDVTDADVIAANPALAELHTFLLMPGTTTQHYTVEEYKKIASAKKTETNKQLQAIPGRIDEAQRAIPEITGTPEELDATMADLQAQHDALAKMKADTIAGNATAAEASRRTAEAEAKLSKAKAAAAERVAKTTQSVVAELSEKIARSAHLRKLAAEGKADAASIRRDIDTMTAIRNDLLEQYRAAKEETWDEGKAVCPTCHRELPEEEVERMREEFNLAKARRLQDINARGKTEASKETIEALRQKAEDLKTAAQNNAQEADHLDAEAAKLRQEIDAAKTEEDVDPNVAACEAELQAARQAEAQDTRSAKEGVAAIEEQMRTVQSSIQSAQAERAKFDLAKAQQQRIAELEAQEKELGAQYEVLEQGTFLCDEFTRTKAKMLTDRINGKFKSVRFRLFQEQQNGGIKDDCEVLVPDRETGALVPYTVANNAGRINAGLEIIEALSKSWELAMPVFIDNAEGITHLPNLDTGTQSINRPTGGAAHGHL